MAITNDINARIEAARKRRQEAAAVADEGLKLIYDDILLGLEDSYDSPDIDTKSKFEAVRAVVFGETPTLSVKEVEKIVEVEKEVGEKLTDDETELLDAFRKGRIKKTDKGAYRDTEWTKLHPPADKPKKADDTSETKVPEPKSDERSKPEPDADTDKAEESKPKADDTSETKVPEPKSDERSKPEPDADTDKAEESKPKADDTSETKVPEPKSDTPKKSLLDRFFPKK